MFNKMIAINKVTDLSLKVVFCDNPINVGCLAKVCGNFLEENVSLQEGKTTKTSY